ncbi:MAG: hypothetical protein J6P72_08460 [Firmicutes bacterium]|nr:hypothetical protein [Bacillota bacterium]
MSYPDPRFYPGSQGPLWYPGMDDNQPLIERMRHRYLTGSELFKEAFHVFKEKPSYYFLLMLLVYLPIQIVLQYQSMQLDLSVESYELLGMQLLRFGMVEMVVMLLEQVAVLVIAVIACYYVERTDPVLSAKVGEDGQVAPAPTETFQTLFYRGVRMWPRAVLTLVVVLFGVISAVMLLSSMMLMPLLGLFAMVGMVLLVILVSLLQSCTATTAALRGRMAFDNIRYVFFILQGRMWRSMGVFAFISFITSVFSIVFSLLTTLLLGGIENVAVSFTVSVVITTLLSVVQLYGYTVGALLFIGAEHRKERIIKDEMPQAGT